MANHIPEDKISEIKNTADIVDIISEVVFLKKAGRNYVGLCPFHSEKTPSFTVNPEKQIYHCFGCSEGGNVFSFLMKYEGLSFPEAVRTIGKRYGIGIPIKTLTPDQQKRIGEREHLFKINHDAMLFFHKRLLESSSGKQAMKYLKDRGLNKNTIDKFYIGYAPKGWENIVKYFAEKKIPLKLVKKSGLIEPKKNNNGFYDRFRNRIIFPIFDLSKQVIGFGGRVMDDSMPKYLNSPETIIYNKRRSLYGIDRAKKKCREKNTVYVVEGYFDALALHLNGIENSVATLGTALTREHVRMLKGFAGRVVMVYDSDEAGINAVTRSIGLFTQTGVEARIIVLPEGFDPDSYLLKYGVESFMNAASESKTTMAFLMNSAIKKHGLSIEGKVRVVSDMKGSLAVIKDDVERSLYIKELSERIGVDEMAVLEMVKKVSLQNKNVHNPATAYGAAKYHTLNKENSSVFLGKWIKLERQIISMMLQFPQIITEVKKRGIIDLIEDETLKSIGKILLLKEGMSKEHISDIIGLIKDDKQRNMAASLAIGEDLWAQKSCYNIIARFESVRNTRTKTLLNKIKEAEKENDLNRLTELLNEKQKIAILNKNHKMTIIE